MTRFIILFSNEGKDGRVLYPIRVRYSLPLKKTSHYDAFHLVVGTNPSSWASYATEDRAKQYLEKCLSGIKNDHYYQDLDYVRRNHLTVGRLEDLQPLIKEY